MEIYNMHFSILVIYFGSVVLHDIRSITLSFISMTRDQVNNTKYNAIVMITAR